MFFKNEILILKNRIKSLANPSKKFKVHINAKQLQMTGILLLLDDINVIVVEGGNFNNLKFKI